MLDGMIQGKLNTLVPADVNSGWRGQSPNTSVGSVSGIWLRLRSGMRQLLGVLLDLYLKSQWV